MELVGWGEKRAPAAKAPRSPSVRARRPTAGSSAADWERQYQDALRHGQPLPSAGRSTGLALSPGFRGIPAGVGLDVPELPPHRETAVHREASAPVGAVLLDAPAKSLDDDVRLAGRRWSDYQRAVFSAIHTGTGHLVIEAVAGSGKTTTLLKAVEFIAPDKRVLIVAFNTSIKKELTTRLSPTLTNVRVSTLTAHGYSILQRYWPDAPYLRPDGGKGDPFGAARDNDVMWAGLPPWSEIDSSDVRWLLKDYEKLLSLCESFLALTPDAIDAVLEDYDLFRARGTAREWSYRGKNRTFLRADVVGWVQRSIAYRLQQPRGPNYARRTFQYLNKYAGNQYDEVTQGGRIPFISFADMTFVPAATPSMEPVEKYDVVIVDESQDMDVAQFALVFRSLAPGGRVVVVGDSRQAIYRFRGADSGGMARLRRELSATLLPLSVSYRVPTCAADEARFIVPEFETPEGTPVGNCAPLPAVDMIRVWRAGDVVISRVNAPLLPLAMMAIQQGINPWILGDENEAAQQLNRIITDATRANPLADSPTVLRDYLEKREANVRKLRLDDLRVYANKVRDPNRRAKLLASAEEDVDQDPKVVTQRLITGAFWNDRGTGLAQRKEVRTIADVRAVLKNITPSAKSVQDMSPEEYQAHIRSRLVLTSVHRIKGGEANRVFVLEDTFKIGRGGRWLKKAPRNPKDADEEKHLWYVAVTRAKNEPGEPGQLFYVTGIKTLLGEDDAYDREDGE